MRRAALACAVALLAACASRPAPPDWQVNAQQGMAAALDAYLAGDADAEARHFARVHGEVARTGSPQRLARVELIRCAARTASLRFEPCAGFERVRADADAPERAYADYLAGRLPPQDAALLPPAQRAVARVSERPDAAHAALREVADPLSRLVAAAVLFQAGRASPETIALATRTASDQGWRRPLLAWLHVQLALAERAGDAAQADRLRRRIAIADGTVRPAP